jgi:hypothetical protein
MVKAGLLDPARRDAAAAALDLRFVELHPEVA